MSGAAAAQRRGTGQGRQQQGPGGGLGHGADGVAAEAGERAAGIGAGVGALGTYIWSSNLEKQRRDMQAATQGTGIGVTQTADNQLKLDIPSDISFATGSAQLAPSLEPILNRFAQTLNENPKTTVRVVGHTDSTGSDAINDPLSVDRARSVKDYLTARGVNAQRVDISGVGSRQPVADNGTPEGRAHNRRVEIFVAESAAPAAPVGGAPAGPADRL